MDSRPADARERRVRYELAVEELKAEQFRLESVPGWENDYELAMIVVAIRRSVRQLQTRYWKEVGKCPV